MKQVSILGLGRMGRAMAERYAAAGWTVRSWSRSGGGSSPTARDAVASGGAVLLALFDDEACERVLDLIGDDLGGRLVINTSTISVDGARALARRVRRGHGRYVHAPVLGSVPAVLGGSLLVLAGGEQADVADAEQVLAPLASRVMHRGDVGDAAAAKIVANASLGAGLLAVRDALEAAAALRLPLATALDVLELGRLGETVRGLRARLEEPGGETHFAVGALRKDLALLGEHPISARLAALPVEDSADVAAVALPHAYQPASAVTR